MQNFSAYESLAASKTHDRFTDYVKIVPLSYDDFFDEQREKWANDASSVSELMTKFPKSDFESHFSKIEATNLLNLQAGLAKDSFFNTHVLDVLLYRFTTVGERIRVSIAKQIVDVLRGADAPTFGFMAHSLGTSVIHDTLHALYSHRTWRKNKISKVFTPGNYKASYLIMLANVSRVLQSPKRNALAYKSKVRPGAGGVCKHMLNVANDYDPFAQVKPFMPGDQWLSGREDKYQHLHLNSVTRPNVHAFTHYLENPAVYTKILQWYTTEGSITDKEKKAAINEYFDTTINSETIEMLSALQKLKIAEPQSWQEVFAAWAKYSDVIKQFADLEE